MTRLFFSNTANSLVLASGVVGTDTAIPFSGTATGWPAVPCKAVLDPDSVTAEVVKITAIGPSSFTVVRGQDGTSAQVHSAGATVEHRWSAAEADEASLHANSTTGVHGLAGALVGSTDTQTLTNKTLTAPVLDTATARASNTAPALQTKAASTGTANTQEWQDSSGVRLSRVGQHGDLLIQPDDATVVPLTTKAFSGQTANSVEVQDSTGAKLAAVDAKGRLILKPSSMTSPGIKGVPPTPTLGTWLNLRDSTDASDVFLLTTLGEITNAAKAWLRGNSTDDVLRFPLDGSKFKVDSSGNIVSAAGLTVAGAVTGATNLPKSTSAVAGKRIHWDTAAVTTDSTGFFTVTHGAGFTPSVVLFEARLTGGHGGDIGVDNITGTTFRGRVDATGVLSLTIMYTCFE